ncbi:alpha/beta hydrolase [Streptomyces sp. NPDC050856]|uniref:alpha/beta hydrolase n=1 Tax=Streptomyces sp. NPDC050856 TaxID=3154939 RepID=UPI0034111F18
MTRRHHDRIDLAAREYGGDGPPLVLLHGAGRTLADWSGVAPLLTGHHRVLAVDLRSHGLSPSGHWSFPAVIGDLEAVLDAYGMPGALPVGHSLGGMLAARYAREHPDTTPGAVNLDGFGWGRPDQYVGADPVQVTERLAQLRELAQAAAVRVLPAGGLADLLAEQRKTSDQLGIPYERLEASARRAVRERPDGRLELRPEREHALEMLAAIDALDVFALFRAVRQPLLLGRALRPVPPIPGMDWFGGLMAAYSRGLARDLAELAAGRSTVTVAGIDGTHAMLLENPRAVADAVLAFTTALEPHR